MSKSVFISADPFVDIKTGVAYASEYLVGRLRGQAAPDTMFDLGFFDLRGTRGEPERSLGVPRRQRRFPSAVYLKLLIYDLAPPLELLWGKRYDVVLCTNNYLMPSLARTKAVIIHDLGYLVCPEHLQPGRSGLLGRIFPGGPAFLAKVIPRAARRADIILTWSHAVKEEIGRNLRVPLDKILVVPFLPDDRHRPDPTTSVPGELDLHQPFVLCQATIEPRKNHRVLVEAFALLPPDLRRSTTLVLAGSPGWSSDSLLERIAELRRDGVDIRVTGYVTEDQRLALYRTCVFAVQPSHYEGFGMPVLEALACGAEVLCSDIPVLREVGGPLARYFDKDDPNDLAQLMSQRLARHAQQGRPVVNQDDVLAHFADLEARGDTVRLATRLGLA